MTNIWQNNIAVFKDTIKKSNTIYKQATDALKENTRVFDDADNIFTDKELILNDNMKISVVAGGTVSTAYKMKVSDNKYVAMLNFADAKRPGGWVAEGAQTQEENICRCTNLYAAITQPKCMTNYYGLNLKAGIPDSERHYNEPYTDALIYSPSVAIFKDDITYDDVPVRFVDVITSPSPCGNVGGVESILEHRMRGIFKVAHYYGVTSIVLGAWGCGAFGQNPEVVAKCFANVLKELPLFDEVVFAIRPTAVRDYWDDVTFSAFAKQFN